MGKNGMRQAYRAALRAGLIGVICALLVACAAAPKPGPEPELPAAPDLMADDLALFERFQAEYALQAGDREAAAERLAKAAMLSDDPKQSLSALRAALFAGRRAAAQALLARWRALRWVTPTERVLPFVELRLARSDDAEDWMHWTAFARDRRAPEVAMRLADLATQRFPRDARVFVLRAALVRERDPAAAVPDLEQALALDGKSALVRMSLAHAYNAAGDAAKAADVVAGIDPATDESITAEIAYASRANVVGYAVCHRIPDRSFIIGGAQLPLCARDTGMFTAALATIAELRASGTLGRDDLVRSYVLEAEVRRRVEDAAAAVAVFDDGLRMLPDDGELMYARALMLAEAGRDDEMERDLRRMIELDPNDADALNALGYSLVDANRQLDEAAALLARAERISPDSAALLDSLGWLAYRRGDLDAALEKLRAAHARLDDPEVAAHLGEVLWKKGEHDAARKIWTEAAARDPEHRTLRETMRRLLP